MEESGRLYCTTRMRSRQGFWKVVTLEKKEGYIPGKGVDIPCIRERDINMKKKEGYRTSREERDIFILGKRKVNR